MRYILITVSQTDWSYTSAGLRDYFLLRDKIEKINSFDIIPTDKFDLRIFNNFIKQKNKLYPILNNSDANSIGNNGRTIVYREEWRPDSQYILLVDLDHKNNTNIKMLMRDLQIEKLL